MRGTSYYRSRLAFHPYTQVIQTICTSVLVRSSTQFSPGFNLPTHRSTGFGYPTNDSRRAHLVPHHTKWLRTFGFPKAPWMIHLTSPLIGTLWPVIRNGRYNAGPHLRASFLSRHISLQLFGFRLFAPPVKGTFQHSLKLLVHYRFQDVFKVGS